MEALYKRKRPHVCAAYNMDSLLSQVLMLRKVKPLRIMAKSRTENGTDCHVQNIAQQRTLSRKGKMLNLLSEGHNRSHTSRIPKALFELRI